VLFALLEEGQNNHYAILLSVAIWLWTAQFQEDFQIGVVLTPAEQHHHLLFPHKRLKNFLGRGFYLRDDETSLVERLQIEM
jgi:hypothetical protein